jgi:phosphoribosylglycinamide formyltransferase-1
LRKIAVLASGGGTNLQALLNAQEKGVFDGTIALVFSNVPMAGALEHAKSHRVETLCIESKSFAGPREEYDAVLLKALQERDIGLVCLAGYMRIFTPVLVKPFLYRMMNIHPALLPKYGGRGLYGHHVHEAVLKAGEKESGATVHFVDEGTDTGPVILQWKVPVHADDSPDSLAARVLEVEHRIYPEAVRLFCADKIRVTDGEVSIKND